MTHRFFMHPTDHRMHYSSSQRRRALQHFAKYTLYFGLGSAAVLTSRKSHAQAPITPNCGTQTPAQLEGPFFTPGSPERSKLVGAQEKAQKIQLSGEVVDSACRPVPGALLDFGSVMKTVITTIAETSCVDINLPTKKVVLSFSR